MDWYFTHPVVCTCIIFLLVRQVKLEIEAIFYHLWAWSWKSDTTWFWLSCDDTQYCVQHRLRLYLFTLCRKDEINFDCFPKHSSPYRPFCSCITACAYHWSCNWFKSIVSRTELDQELPNGDGTGLVCFLNRSSTGQSKPAETSQNQLELGGLHVTGSLWIIFFFLYFCYYYYFL